ncbi:hypothetical protein EVAR_56872_1 [Eumeta japonica]|uniref:Uncharacterized protein n=1 Tax=Eumeta variegata TaxID=151549 RepID=A0A4C1ZA78_EUMVA|nr:hypothetical protein EVAR_56872_1 [Eumeta japonica]
MGISTMGNCNFEYCPRALDVESSPGRAVSATNRRIEWLKHLATMSVARVTAADGRPVLASSSKLPRPPSKSANKLKTVASEVALTKNMK